MVMGSLNSELAVYNGTHGVWMIYDYDQLAVLISTHVRPVKAIEKLSELGHGRIGFLPIDMEFQAAVKLWEEGDV